MAAPVTRRADGGSDLTPSITNGKVELDLSSPDQLTSPLKNARSQNLATQDEALTFLSLNGNVSRHITQQEDALLLRKIDRHLMPIMFCIFFLQLMDKQTLSLCSVFGLAKDTNLVGDEYSLLGSIVWLSLYVPVIVTLWGMTLACMAAAKNFVGLLIARFFLGVFEASIQASSVLIVQIWYRRQEQGIRLAVLYSSIGWVHIFGSLIMYGLGHIHSNIMRPYQLISLLLGGITILVGFLSFFKFPDNAVRCKFLSNEEKAMTIEWFNKKYSRKSPVILLGLLCSSAAAMILLVTGRAPKDQPVLLLAYYMLSTFITVPATVTNWQSSNVAGHTKKSATTAFMLMGAFSGSIVGPLLFSTKEKPYYRKGWAAVVRRCRILLTGVRM
ncbi:MFS general substrate transporter [Agrocybe pediades]|nr:MFS general substrate transporter [Agrocybe pediades]